MLDMVELNKKPTANGKTIANTYIDQINNVGNLAQQAMIPLNIGSELVNLRFQSHPAVDGFDVVVRILRTNNTERSKKLSLTTLGYTNSQIDTINLALGSAWGGYSLRGSQDPVKPPR
jgi:type II secretory ATPase GspE/PulE/Tfp pilus assembly ATPase PilB-like protein